MDTGTLCCAQRDSHFASQAAEYLNLHSSLCWELAGCRQPADFLDLIEQCLTHKLVVVLLSPESVPAPWPRQLWEPVLVDAVRQAEAQIAYVLLANCALPPILRRKNFFDLTQHPSEGLRSLRRWAIDRIRPERVAPAIAHVCEQKNAPLYLVHQPGIAWNVSPEDSSWMVNRYWQDFEAVYRLPCAHRSRTGILGELAEQMGLRLSGPLALNSEALTKEAARQRSLYIFEHLPEELISLAELGGKASVIVTRAAEPPCVTFAGLRELFFTPNADEDACIRALDAFCTNEGNLESWTDAYTISSRGLSLLLQRSRLAEAHELLKWMAAGARRASDYRALGRIQWEESWILQSWDLAPHERANLTQTQPVQLAFPI